jgi:hypothetical protein
MGKKISKLVREAREFVGAGPEVSGEEVSRLVTEKVIKDRNREARASRFSREVTKIQKQRVYLALKAAIKAYAERDWKKLRLAAMDTANTAYDVLQDQPVTVRCGKIVRPNPSNQKGINSRCILPKGHSGKYHVDSQGKRRVKGELYDYSKENGSR